MPLPILLPPVHAQSIEVLIDQAAQLQKAGRVAEALPLHQRVLEQREATLGPEHPDTASSLNDLAVLNGRMGRHAEALALHRRALAIREKALGPEHPLTAQSLNNLAVIYRAMGRNADALELHQRALAIREKVLGPEHVDTAQSLDNLGNLMLALGQSSQALPLSQRALSIRERLLGPEHAETARSLDNLAAIYIRRDQYAEALPLMRRALSIREKVLGPEHPDTATTLNNLASLYGKQGDVANGMTAVRRALAIREKSLGADHLETADSLHELGVLHWVQGQLAEAMAAFRRALAIREKALGPEHALVALSLHVLSGLHLEQGQVAEAVALDERALAIREKRLGAEHPATAANLRTLAYAYGKQARYADAVPLAKRALAIHEKTLGPDHSATATTLNFLADVLRGQGQYSEALPLYERALAIREKSFGPEHFETAFTLSTLGMLHAARGDPARALPLFRRALAIREKTFGPNHLDVAWALDDIASLYQAADGVSADVSHRADLHFDEALALARRSTAIRASRATATGRADADRDVVGMRSELQLARSGFLTHLRLLAIASAGAADARDGLAAESFQVAQLARASDTASAVAQMAARFARGDDELAALIRSRQDKVLRLRSLDGELLKEQPARQQGTVDQTQSEIHDVEAQLAAVNSELDRRFPDYQVLTANAPLPLRDAQALLRADEALLSYLVGEKESYLWVLRKNEQKFLRLAIGRKELDASVRGLRRTLDMEQSHGRLQPYPAGKAHELYRKIFAPAVSFLGGARHVMLVPDGTLQSLPFGVLVAERPAKGADHASLAWLARRYAFSTLPSEASLKALRRYAVRQRAPDPFVGFGDPAFKGTPGATRSLTALYSSRGLADVDQLSQLAPLPDSAREIAAMALALGAGGESIFLGAAATETQVKLLDLARYRTMAFATHAFTAGEIRGAIEPALALSPPEAPTADDDGLLTASEIARLRLNADWVILSACNTAAPDGTLAAEGLSGLARAFIYAGSRSLLVSHWPVDSRATARLTTRMLQEIRERPDRGKEEALRRAMLVLIGSGTYSHPVFWAPFVVVGD